MKITMIYNTVHAFATQRNATQRNAYHHYILNNNFKFYIFQFFKAVNFLSVFIRFAKNQFAIISHCHYEGNARDKVGQSPSNLFSVDCFVSLAMTMKNQFANLNNNGASAHCVNNSEKSTQGVKTPCYKKWIASLIPFVRNDNFNYAFSCALKNKFEIISQLNYGFCYKNYFFNLNQVFRNNYDFGRDFDFGRNLNYGFGKDYNCNFKKNCDYDFEKNCSGGFGKNYFENCNFGFDFWNEICSIGNNLAGFLFNRKILKTKI